MQKSLQQNTINRREMLRKTAMVSSLFAAGRLPLLAQSAGGQKKNTIPCEVVDISGHLRSFKPFKNGSLKQKTETTLVYDILNWRGRNMKTEMTRHVSGGTLTITSRNEAAEKIFHVKRILNSAVGNTVTADLVCTKAPVSCLESWVMKSRLNIPDERLKQYSFFKETGSVKEGKVSVRRNDAIRTFSAENPVLTQWQIPGIAVLMKEKKEDLLFDLMQDCALFKPRHRLSYKGSFRVEVKGRKSIKLHSVLQTGQGVLPTHFLICEKGLPQLVTAGMLSWSLNSVAG